MASNGSMLIGLKDAFAAAAIEPHKWPLALSLLAEATGSARAQLIGVGGSNAIPFNWVTNAPNEALTEFEAIGGGSPDVNFRVTAGMAAAPMQVVAEKQYDAAIPRLKTDVYLDFCERYEMPFGIQTTLQCGPEGLIGLAALRSRKDGRSSAEQRRTFGFAADHAAAAVRTQAALEHQGALLVAGSLDAVGLAAVLIDGAGIVRHITCAADLFLRRQSALRIESGYLTAAASADRAAIQSALGVALRSPDQTCTTLLLGRTSPEQSAAALSVIGLPPQEWSLPFRPRAIVVIRCSAPPKFGADVLEQAFGLTRSESSIAVLVAQGLSRAEIARERGVSLGTVRTQYKNLFEKVGVSREAQLVAKLRDLLY